jgi:flagellar motor switch protein FliN/FliY
MNEQKVGQQSTVQSVKFSPIVDPPPIAPEKKQLSLLTDVSLQVTFELGRTKKKVREILGLEKGSVIKLDKLAGETIDVLANQVAIATGELVVVDDQFSVRIAEILSEQEREKQLK